MQSNPIRQFTDMEELMRHFHTFSYLYDKVRVIDTTTHDALDDGLRPAGLCYAHWTANRRCANCVSDAACRAGSIKMKMEYDHGTAYLITAVPVTVGGRLMAVEMIKDIGDSLVFTDRERGTIQHIDRLIRSIGEVTMRDALTGLYNRRFVEDQMPRELAAAADRGKPVSVILLDLDGFKTVNDAHGHAAGDAVLTAAARELQSCVRGDDWVARYGGEEFLALLWDTGRQGAVLVAERMRARLERNGARFDGRSISVTASFGVFSCTPGTSCTDPVAQADGLMYRAKRCGGNRVAAGE